MVYGWGRRSEVKRLVDSLFEVWMFAHPTTPCGIFFLSSFCSKLSTSIRRLLLLALPDTMKLFDRTSSSGSLKSGTSESDKSSQNSKKRQADNSEATKVIPLTLS